MNKGKGTAEQWFTFICLRLAVPLPIGSRINSRGTAEKWISFVCLRLAVPLQIRNLCSNIVKKVKDE